jgi:hypothetical protein
MMMDNKIQMETILRWFRKKSGNLANFLNAGKESLQAKAMTALSINAK